MKKIFTILFTSITILFLYGFLAVTPLSAQNFQRTTAGDETFTIPNNGTNLIIVTLDGAHGGGSSDGGTGGHVVATFTVSANDVIRVIVGDNGGIGGWASGGGGGTAIINTTTGTLLAVAGGGGGGDASSNQGGGGQNGDPSGGAGGGAPSAGGGGGGFSGAGTPGCCGKGCGGGAQANINNSTAGGVGCLTNGAAGGAGFGGGGGGAGNWSSGGGGGGYKGGDSSQSAASNSTGGFNYVDAGGTGVTNDPGDTGGSTNADGSVTVNFGPLPVELIDFAANAGKEVIDLYWRTASELNNEGFDLQRSPDARNWETLEFISGFGTSLEKRSYTYTDKNPLKGQNYYRLKQMDYDGQFEYSKVVSVEVVGERNAMLFSPNPGSEGGSVNLRIDSENFESGELTLFDMTGKAVLVQKISSANMDLDLSYLSKGIYAARLTFGGEQLVEKLLIE